MAVGAVAEPEKKVAPKAIANVELVEAFTKWAKNDTNTSSFFGEACRIARDKKLDKETVKLSLKKARPNWEDSTLGSEVSRVWKFTKPENAKILQDMIDKKITITQARALITKKQLKPKKSLEVRFDERIASAAKYAAEHAKELLIDMDADTDEDEAKEAAREAFLERCGSAFDEAVREHPLKATAAEGPKDEAADEDEAGEEDEETGEEEQE